MEMATPNSPELPLFTTLDFTSFFTTALLGAAHFFNSWAALD